MHRFFLPPDQCRASALTLAGSEAHHALHVLRIKRGERVTVLDGAGSEFLCEVTRADRREMHLSVVQKMSLPPPTCQITLLQCVPKGKIIESIIQKATELGVARIVPILSDRVVSHLDSDDAAHKTEKWQHVAVESIKQCGSMWLPKVETPVTPERFTTRNEAFELSLVGSLQKDARHPQGVFQEFRARHGRRPITVCVWIGPEGDFTPAEMDVIKNSGAQPITLGQLVLRVETAAIYCMSILRYETQDLAPARATE